MANITNNPASNKEHNQKRYALMRLTALKLVGHSTFKRLHTTCDGTIADNVQVEIDKKLCTINQCRKCSIIKFTIKNSKVKRKSCKKAD